MDKKTRMNFLFIITVIIPIFGGYYYYDIKRTSNYINALYREYPKVLYEDSIYGKITNIRPIDNSLNIRYNPDMAFVTLDERVNLRILAVGYDTLSLNNVLSLGAYIRKKQLSDTLIVYKKNSSSLWKFKLLDDGGFDLKNK